MVLPEKDEQGKNTTQTGRMRRRQVSNGGTTLKSPAIKGIFDAFLQKTTLPDSDSNYSRSGIFIIKNGVIKIILWMKNIWKH